MPFKVIPPYYQAWHSMKDRCYNPNHKQFKDYGGRGIAVCDGWRNSYKTFADDMGPRPDGYTLDRIDNNGNYTPENCRWASRKEQVRNRRNTVYVVIDGIEYKAIELSDISGLKVDTIVERADKGYSYDKVMSKEKLHDLSGLALGGQASGAKRRQKTHCKNGHEFTPENTYITKEGWRNCRECHREKMRRRNAAKRRKRNENP